MVLGYKLVAKITLKDYNIFTEATKRQKMKYSYYLRNGESITAKEARKHLAAVGVTLKTAKTLVDRPLGNYLFDISGVDVIRTYKVTTK